MVMTLIAIMSMYSKISVISSPCTVSIMILRMSVRMSCFSGASGTPCLVHTRCSINRLTLHVSGAMSIKSLR